LRDSLPMRAAADDAIAGWPIHSGQETPRAAVLRAEQACAPMLASLSRWTRSSAVVAPARPLHPPGGAGDRTSARPSRVAHRGKQQRCPRRPGACRTRPLAPPASARGIAGGARSISRLPGRRAAPFPKRNRHERGDRTSAFPRRQSPGAGRPGRVQRRPNASPQPSGVSHGRRGQQAADAVKAERGRAESGAAADEEEGTKSKDAAPCRFRVERQRWATRRPVMPVLLARLA
jgi:hypothetical protein